MWDGHAIISILQLRKQRLKMKGNITKVEGIGAEIEIQAVWFQNSIIFTKLPVYMDLHLEEPDLIWL